MSVKKNTKFPKVEMLPAFLWTCPECGRDQFERAVVVELSVEEMAEMREDHGVEVWEAGEFLTCPTTVRCDHCKVTFDTQQFRDEEDD